MGAMQAMELPSTTVTGVPPPPSTGPPSDDGQEFSDDEKVSRIDNPADKMTDPDMIIIRYINKYENKYADLTMCPHIVRSMLRDGFKCIHLTTNTNHEDTQKRVLKYVWDHIKKGTCRKCRLGRYGQRPGDDKMPLGFIL